MPLNLNDLMQKAKDKGITSSNVNNAYQQLIRPWQQESILFEKIKEPQTIKEDPNNRQQIDNKSTTTSSLKQTIYEINTIQTEDNKSIIQESKIDNKSATSCSLSALVGLQRAILIFIYNECKIARSKITESLTLEHISSALNTSCGSVKTTIQRLETKGFIKRICFKHGRGGWSRYSIPGPLFQELLQYESSNKLITNWQQIENKTATLQSAIAKAPLNNSMITMLPKDLKNIDYSALEEIGFDESHIIQIYREYTQKPELSLSVDIIQNSINALAFDLKYNNVASSFKISPAVVLTSLLKKGQPYSSKTPEKVLTPQEEAMQSYLLAQEKKQQMVTEIESKAKSLALQEWLDLLSEDELLKFNQEPRLEGIPDKIYQISRRKKAIEFAKDYFNTVLWHKKRKEILDETKQKI